MIQEIPYKYDPAYKDKKPELTDYLLHYEYNKVMLLKEKEGYVIPTFQAVAAKFRHFQIIYKIIASFTDGKQIVRLFPAVFF